MKSSHKKGQELEKEFAEFMKSNLGYNKTSFTEHGSDTVAKQSGWQIDIHGQKENKNQRKKYNDALEKSKEHEKRSNLFIALSFVFLIYLFSSLYTDLELGHADLELFLDSILSDIYPKAVGFGGLILFCILSAIAVNSKQAAKKEVSKQKETYQKLTEFTWVECKNISTRVKRDMVNKLDHAFKEHNKSIKNKIKKHKQDVIYKNAYFVTSLGYASDALAKARDFKITCYVKDDKKGFIKVK